VHPPPSPARANFTLMTECTPESSGYDSVYSVVPALSTGAYTVTLYVMVNRVKRGGGVHPPP
jgi:hypothetical protein